jgi:hypothetical protein
MANDLLVDRRATVTRRRRSVTSLRRLSTSRLFELGMMDGKNGSLPWRWGAGWARAGWNEDIWVGAVGYGSHSVLYDVYWLVVI